MTGVPVSSPPRAFVIRQTCRWPGQLLLSLIGALGFYHRRVFLPVLTRAFANFSLLSLLSPKMRSQSLLEIPLNPTRKRSWCSLVFGFGVDVGVGVGVGVDVGVDVDVGVEVDVDVGCRGRRRGRCRGRLVGHFR